MLRRVALVRTVVSEESRAPIIRVTSTGELGTTLAVTSNRRTLFLRSVRRLLVTANVPSSPILVTLMMERLDSFETSALTKATLRNIPGDGILHNITKTQLLQVSISLLLFPSVFNTNQTEIAIKYIQIL
jgi:hypothetical protein